MKHLLGKKLNKLWRDRMGGVFIYAAIAAPVVIGAAGLSVDVGMWYANKRLIQSAVDSAALAGALELRRSNGNATSIANAVNADALINGYSTAAGDIITIEPSTSPLVAVTIIRTVPGLLSQVVFTETTNVRARAVARADVNDSCIWSLNPTAAQAINTVGSADVSLGCGMIANTDDPDGIHKEGSGCLAASEFKVAGGYDETLNSGCPLDPVPETSIPPADDPLASLPAPSYSSSPCFGEGGGPNPNKVTGGDNQTFVPGVYCKNIEINTSGIVTFEPGLYVLDGVGLKITGGSTVVGTGGVTFYLSPTGGMNDGVDIAGTGNVTLNAPTSGAYAGILIYQDRNTAANITHKMSGGSTMLLDGIIYAPSTDVEFTGGSSVDSSSIVIIADEVEFKGGDTFLGDFDTSSILNNALMLQAKLVE
ncbi:MAG: pilus assembly protein TadG-related protein [Alphaproteobacteria bacterium]